MHFDTMWCTRNNDMRASNCNDDAYVVLQRHERGYQNIRITSDEQLKKVRLSDNVSS